MDGLCDQVRGKDGVIACFDLGFSTGNGKSATGTLGSLLKWLVRGMERIPGEISHAFRE